ncbi:RagB/SusD family nutrient uptake outer membrane protein [Lacibacter sp. H407]|uniref:RagB/SusD family nutrient uptake outer membrane protein n=1 Tax=Lacibacter sp. H407 TaxID=3133423 RepID=UPI0030C05D67
MKYIIIFAVSITLLSCKKYLDEKPSSDLAIPTSAKEVLALLDNSTALNGSWPSAIELGSDDYYITTAQWQVRPLAERNAYIWAEDVFNENERNAWSLTYTNVYIANVVLDALKKEGGLNGSQSDLNNAEGQALFYRAFAFYHLLQLFTKPYNAATAANDPGIPLRLDSDFNKPTTRAALQQSYDQVINDLKTAVQLLPVTQEWKTRPSKAAALTLLARIYLIMQKYQEASAITEQALQSHNSLLDFNTLNETLANPISLFNAEVIFHSVLGSVTTLITNAKVDSVLYNAYNTNDKRKTVFFRRNTDGSYAFKGSYDGSVRLFNGFTSAELYLMKAELLARAGNTSDAMNALNQLLIKRWKSGTFTPLTAATAQEALTIILQERRKELVLRGVRWSDVRRLNQSSATAITIKRLINNQIIELLPGSNRYVYKIPDLVIQMTGIPQNP